MSEDATLREVERQAISGELKPGFLETALDKEGFCIQFLGIDGEGRAVFYTVDDCSLFRFQYDSESRELEKDDWETLRGPDTESWKLDPNAAAFLYLTQNGEDWEWIHPRFRWLDESLDEIQAKEPV